LGVMPMEQVNPVAAVTRDLISRAISRTPE
jgi:hypothetical protein